MEAFISYVADNATPDRGPHGIVTGAQAIRETLLLEFKDPRRSSRYAAILLYSLNNRRRGHAVTGAHGLQAIPGFAPL